MKWSKKKRKNMSCFFSLEQAKLIAFVSFLSKRKELEAKPQSPGPPSTTSPSESCDACDETFFPWFTDVIRILVHFHIICYMTLIFFTMNSLRYGTGFRYQTKEGRVRHYVGDLITCFDGYSQSDGRIVEKVCWPRQECPCPHARLVTMTLSMSMYVSR